MAAVEIPTNIRAVQVQPDKTVKVIQIPFGQDDLVKNLPEDQLIIRVRAVALNPTDWKHGIGEWGAAGTILGCDSAGDVVKVGSAVKHLKVGDRVAGFNYGGSYQTNNGAYAEFVRLYASVTFKLPDELSYEEGASLPIPHLTAVQVFYMRLNIPKPFSPPAAEKEIILIWGGSTAVGHNAIQLARTSGLRVFVTASPAVHEELKTLGAEQTFDYKAVDVVKQIQDAAGERGIIYAIDTVGELSTTNSTIDALSLSRSGHLVSILPPDPSSVNRRKDVKVEFSLVYTLLGLDFTFASAFKYDAIPEDKALSLEYVSTYMPRVLEGWKAGQGSTSLKPQRLRKLEGGLEKIEEGLKIMRDGKYGREKLVYTIA
ncbi:chaperonin 10-like protein [Lentinula edodes]|uniref:chaperonin 10-like protein n=1 Tax=Lentinula edodes TaxID=5353 RepID=UPI001E8CD6F4|nr:chaperonin 10-like protein [Lentinula edodes]KAH7869401.1 chaperonin 10-like protein [Lentinula edodes]KAJ3909451.1 chaperonin 10-like protein [Lentinula edodes]